MKNNYFIISSLLLLFFGKIADAAVIHYKGEYGYSFSALLTMSIIVTITWTVIILIMMLLNKKIPKMKDFGSSGLKMLSYLLLWDIIILIIVLSKGELNQVLSS